MSAVGQDEVAGAKTGCDRLRERRRVGHELAALELVQRRRRFPLVADEAVRVVLEHGQALARDDLGDAPPPLLAERAPTRVLEGRDRVQERRRFGPARQLVLERVGIEPFVVHRERDDLGALPREDLQRAVVARRFDEDTAGTAREELGRIEHEAEEPAHREHDAVRPDAVARADPFAKRPVAAGRAVREDARPDSQRDIASALGELGGRDEVRCRGTACERDGRSGHARSLSSGALPTAGRRSRRPRSASCRHGCHAPRAPPSSPRRCPRSLR